MNRQLYKISREPTQKEAIALARRNIRFQVRSRASGKDFYIYNRSGGELTEQQTRILFRSGLKLPESSEEVE